MDKIGGFDPALVFLVIHVQGISSKQKIVWNEFLLILGILRIGMHAQQNQLFSVKG